MDTTTDEFQDAVNSHAAYFLDDLVQGSSTVKSLQSLLVTIKLAQQEGENVSEINIHAIPQAIGDYAALLPNL